MTLGPVLAHEDVVLAIPLAAGSLVVNLNAVAIGVPEVDAQGDTVVGHFKLNALLFDMSVELFQVVQAVYPPGHVVEAYAAGLDAVLAHILGVKEGEAAPAVRGHAVDAAPAFEKLLFFVFNEVFPVLLVSSLLSFFAIFKLFEKMCDFY